MTFPVTAQQTKDYLEGGDSLTFLLTSGPGNSEGSQLWLSGFALVPNNYGFTQHPALTLHWDLNGEKSGEINWGGEWENEGLAVVPSNTTKIVYVKVVDKTKNLLVTFHEHNNNWHGGTLNVKVGGDSTIFKPSAGIIGISSTLYTGKLHMRPQSIIIPASIVASQITTSASGVSSVIKLNLQNTGNNKFHIRGIDTEIYP